MNKITSEYNIETHSVQIRMVVEINPQMGVDREGTFKKASWADCATALAVVLDNLEQSQPVITEIIEAEINGIELDGNTNGDDEQGEN
jgi:hypothetical protein